MSTTGVGGGDLDYLTVKQAAEALSVSTTTVYAWCAKGMLPHLQVVERGVIRIPAGEIEKRVLR